MSDIIRFTLRDEFLARMRGILPGITSSDLEALDVLVVRDCLLTDDGSPHPELLVWVHRILDRDAGQAVPASVRPVPKTGPAGAEVVA